MSSVLVEETTIDNLVLADASVESVRIFLSDHYVRHYNYEGRIDDFSFSGHRTQSDTEKYSISFQTEVISVSALRLSYEEQKYYNLGEGEEIEVDEPDFYFSMLQYLMPFIKENSSFDVSTVFASDFENWSGEINLKFQFHKEYNFLNLLNAKRELSFNAQHYGYMLNQLLHFGDIVADSIRYGPPNYHFVSQDQFGMGPEHGVPKFLETVTRYYVSDGSIVDFDRNVTFNKCRATGLSNKQIETKSLGEFEEFLEECFGKS